MREPDDEGRTTTETGALGTHRAAVELDQMAHDGQAHTKTAVLARGRRVVLREAVEQPRRELR